MRFNDEDQAYRYEQYLEQREIARERKEIEEYARKEAINIQHQIDSGEIVPEKTGESK